MSAEDRWGKFRGKNGNKVITNTTIGKVWATPAPTPSLGEVSGGGGGWPPL